jgi:hypothetical protein
MAAAVRPSAVLGEARDARLARLRAAGTPTAAIAAELGMCPGGVTAAAARLGLVRRAGRPKAPPTVRLNPLPHPQACVCGRPAVGRCVAGPVCGDCHRLVVTQQAAMRVLLPQGNGGERTRDTDPGASADDPTA